jgi:hypothetical protein
MANFDELIKELRRERDNLDKAIAVLNSLNAQPKRGAIARPKRHISPAGLARIRAAAKARWAKVRAQKKK